MNLKNRIGKLDQARQDRQGVKITVRDFDDSDLTPEKAEKMKAEALKRGVHLIIVSDNI